MLTSIWLPITVALLALALVLAAQRDVRRGGARIYQLERDSVLRRANLFLTGAIVLVAFSVGLLVYNQRQVDADAEEAAQIEATLAVEATVAAGTPTPTSQVDSLPPAIEFTPTPTIDPNLPTPTPTPIIRRAEVVDTGGSGVNLRRRPSTLAEEIEILDELTVVTILDDEGTIQAEGYTWIKIRTLGGVEGWVVDLFLEEFDP